MAAALVALLLASCGGGDNEPQQGDQRGEVVITCAACQESPTDPFLQYNSEVVGRFNKKYAGRYRVDIVQNQYATPSADRLQYYQRLALADDLPDIFLLGSAEIEELAGSGKLMDFTPSLEKNPEWRDSFYDGAFDSLKGPDGQTWAIPQQRDAIGIYYNKELLEDAGVAQFPQTWDELAASCEKIKATGKACLALDGDWVTLLMWANLIGTQPGGAEFMNSGIAGTDYAGNAEVVKATETLKGWHTDGYINKDAFSGDYQDAANAYLNGDAAMIANGPWMVSADIKGKNAIEGLYEQTGYEPSPGWADERGLIVVAGNAGFLSGSTDEREQEAVVEFMKFLTSREESIEQIRKTGAYPAVEVELAEEEAKELEPLAAELVEQSSSIPLTYPNAYLNAPPAFATAWKNLWPSYVKGDLDTQEFLSRLATDANSATG